MSGASQAQGAASDGKHGSNVTAILESLAADPEKAKAAADYGFSKYVAELSLEELMAANLSGDGLDEHPTHCIVGTRCPQRLTALAPFRVQCKCR